MFCFDGRWYYTFAKSSSYFRIHSSNAQGELKNGWLRSCWFDVAEELLV